MKVENKELQNLWPVCKPSYRPITSKIIGLIASQLSFAENESPLQKNSELISGCMGTVPVKRFEQNWKDLVTSILLPGQVLIGIGACIGPNNVNTAVKEALSGSDMDLNQISQGGKVIIGIFTGSNIDDETVARIETLVLNASCQDIDCKVIQYDEMQDLIAVLIIVK